MSRYHLSFRNFHPDVLKATEVLFHSRPWASDDEDQFVKYERWLQQACAAYDIKPVALELHEGINQPHYNVEPPTIILNKYSVTSLFLCFRIHMQEQEVARVGAHSDEYFTDAFGWATSLFYRVRPILFRRAVRAGRIHGIAPEELLHPDTRVSICRNCEETVFPLTRDALEGEQSAEGLAWRHVLTGQVQCELESDNASIATPVEA